MNLLLSLNDKYLKELFILTPGILYPRGSPYPSSVEIEWKALLVAVQDLMKITVSKENATLQEGMGWLPRELLYPTHGLMEGLNLCMHLCHNAVCAIKNSGVDKMPSTTGSKLL